MILRTEYLEKLTQWKDKDIIKVITGVRRCGKSTLMSQWKQKLQDNNIDTNHIIHINLEMLENESLLEYHALHEKIISQCKDDNMYYVLLDEIQSVENFQKAIDSLNVRENIDLYITGSNAYLLSGTLATLLSGRYIEIKMLPFSFAEFIDARKSNKITTQRLWSDYIHDGSFPAITQLKNDPNLTYDYLEGILNTILIKDVTQRTGGNAALARNISSYIYDNIGNIISPSSIAKSMSNAGHSITAPTVANYLNSLEAAYLVYSANR